MNIWMTSIIGTRFRGSDAVTIVGALPRGSRLRLEREPDNAFDPNAIAVYYGDTHLGYVPRVHATELAPALDAGTAESDVELIDEGIVDRGDVRFAPKIAVRCG
jgi:hypothetical protein